MAGEREKDLEQKIAEFEEQLARLKHNVKKQRFGKGICLLHRRYLS